HPMQLRDVAGAARHDQFAPFRVPAYDRRRLEFRIGRDLRCQSGRYRRNAFRLQVAVGRDDVGGKRERRSHQRDERSCQAKEMHTAREEDRGLISSQALADYWVVLPKWRIVASAPSDSSCNSYMLDGGRRESMSRAMNSLAATLCR